jgi:hypothetical protein
MIGTVRTATGSLLLVPERAMNDLDLQEGQTVDDNMVDAIICHHYAWILTELELKKAGAA